MIQISYIGGTIRKSEQMSFKKLVFRATRGKAFAHFFGLESDSSMLAETRDLKDKLVYIIAFVEGSHLRDKLAKICNASSSDQVFDI